MKPCAFLLAALFSFVALTSSLQGASQDVTNLKGIDGIYMGVNLRAVVDRDLNLGQDIRDIVELEMFRNDIPFKSSVDNSETEEYPKLVVDADVERSGVRNTYVITLSVLDYAVIERNRNRIIAETYKIVSRTSKPADSYISSDLKTETRLVMQDFVKDFKQANP